MLSKKYWLLSSLYAAIIVLVLICFACSDSDGGELAVFTNKTEYEQGEVIKISLSNNFGECIFSHIRSVTPVFCIKYIERKIPDGDWERLFAQCQPPHCMQDIDVPGEIKPGETVTMEWNPQVFVNGTQETVQPDPGLYRLSILYEDCQKLEWKSVYTNEFIIHLEGGENESNAR